MVCGQQGCTLGLVFFAALPAAAAPPTPQDLLDSLLLDLSPRLLTLAASSPHAAQLCVRISSIFVERCRPREVLTLFLETLDMQSRCVRMGGGGPGCRPAGCRFSGCLRVRVGVAETNGILRVFKVYWRPQLILKISQLLKT